MLVSEYIILLENTIKTIAGQYDNSTAEQGDSVDWSKPYDVYRYGAIMGRNQISGIALLFLKNREEERKERGTDGV